MYWTNSSGIWPDSLCAFPEKAMKDRSVIGAGTIRHDPSIALLQTFELPASPDLLGNLLTDLFRDDWRESQFGILIISGSVFEMVPKAAPRYIGYLGGYLAVDFDPSHIHVCIWAPIGKTGNARSGREPDYGQSRTGRAELYRSLVNLRGFAGNGPETASESPRLENGAERWGSGRQNCMPQSLA